MLRGLINTVLWFCAPTPGGYLHALIYKRIQKPLQALKGYFLGHFSFPLNLLLKQLLHSLSKPEQQRCLLQQCQGCAGRSLSLLRPREHLSDLPWSRKHQPPVQLTTFDRGRAAAHGVIWLNLIANSPSSNDF